MTYYNDVDARLDHAREMGEDSPSDRAWFAFCREVENLLGVETLDGDYAADGYCLDEAHGLFINGTSPAKTAFFFAMRMKMLARGEAL